MDSVLDVQVLHPSFTKNFKVDYFRIREDLWRAMAQVEDPIYNVIVSLDISVPAFVIRNAVVRFLNFPRKDCLKAAPKMKELIGSDVRGQFRDILRRELLGPKGCDTIFNLVNMSGRALIFAYLAEQVGLGTTSTEQYCTFFEKGAGCVIDQKEGSFVIPFLPKDCVPVVKKPETGGQPVTLEMDEHRPIHGRRITVDYFELSDNLWRARSHIVDYEHNIFLTLDIATADLVVRDASMTFLRQPFKDCNWMQPRMKKIVGACLATDFRQRVAKDFIGVEGCGNAYVLMNSMHRGFMEFYFWRNSVTERISAEQASLCKEGLKQDCIACGL